MEQSNRNAACRRNGVFGLALSVALLPVFVSPTVAAANRNLPDESITDAIEDELVSDRVVPMTQLDVLTAMGSSP